MIKFIFKIIFILSVITYHVFPVYAVSDSKVKFERGMVAFRSNNWKVAKLNFEQVKNNDDEYKERAHFYFARSIYSLGKYNSAIYEFNSFIGECNDNVLCSEAYFWIAESYSKTDEKTRAIEEYKRYIDNGKNQPFIDIAHDKIAVIYFNQKRYNEAIFEWRKSTKVSTDKNKNGQIICNIGESYFYNNDIDKALKTIYPILTSNLDIKTTSRSRLIAGQIYMKKKNFKKALIVFNGIPKRVIGEYPFYEAQYYKGISNLAMGRKNKASFYLDLFIIIGKDSKWFQDARFQLGKIKISRGKRVEGLKLIDSVRKNTNDTDLYKKTTEFLSRIYLDIDAKKSIPLLLELVKLGRGEDIKDSRFLLGKAYMSIGEYKKSERIYSFFLKDYPFCEKLDEINFMLGRIYLKLDNQDKALSLFENIKNENPFSPYLNEINFYLALMKYNNKEYDKSQTLLKGYLNKRESKNKFEANKLMVLSYLEQNKIKKARRYLYIIMSKYKKEKDADVIIYKFARKYFESGKKSSKYFNFIFKHYPKSESESKLIYYLAEYNYKNSKYKLALKFYNKYLLTGEKENSGRAYFNKLICLNKLKKYDAVISTIESGKIPPLKTKQWEKIPLFVARAFYYSNKIEKSYSLFLKVKQEKLTDLDKHLLVIGSISVNDLNTAVKYSELITSDKNLYSASVYKIAKFYLRNGENNKAEKFFNEVIINNPNGDYAEKASIQLAYLNTIYGKYLKALGLLSNIKKKGNESSKYALESLILLKTGKEIEALTLANKKIKLISKGVYGEIVTK